MAVKGKRIDGELYWPFRCEHGHDFYLGPIHDPEAHLESENPNSSAPGSGEERHVPDETPCKVCFEEGLEEHGGPGTWIPLAKPRGKPKRK